MVKMVRKRGLVMRGGAVSETRRDTQHLGYKAMIDNAFDAITHINNRCNTRHGTAESFLPEMTWRCVV